MSWLIHLRPGLSTREQRLIRSHMRDVGIEPHALPDDPDLWRIADMDGGQVQLLEHIWGVEQIVNLDDGTRREGKRSDLEFVLPKLILWMSLFALLIVLALAFPQGLGEQPNLHVEPEHLRAEWYLLFLQSIFSVLPGSLAAIGVLALLGAFLIVFLWPFIETAPATAPKDRPLPMLLGAGALFALLALTVYGWFSL